MFPITLKTTAAGIPCKAKVNHYKKHKGTYSPIAIDPEDFYGRTELDYELRDRKGYPAPWLEKKLDQEGLLDEFETGLMEQLDEHLQGLWENKQDMLREERKLRKEI